MLKSYAGIKQRWTGDSRYDRYFATKMNNARLNTMATYYDLMPGFTRILNECGGDAEKFFAKLEAMKPMSKEQRRATVKGERLP
jgi:predicted aminopeptidase